MVNAEVAAAVQKLNVATNTLRDGQVSMGAALDGASTRVFALSERIKEHMTAAEVAAVRASIDANTDVIDAVVTGMSAASTSLNGLAANPEVPVPEPVPEPPVIEEPPVV